MTSTITKTAPTYEDRQFLPWSNAIRKGDRSAGPDQRSGAVYLLDSDLRLAAETAIVTRRPLLLRGEPGCGKSSFGAFAARNLNWRYYETTITGRTEARDLQWRFDALSRLHDAQATTPASGSISPVKYVIPSILWWAFNRKDALEFIQERKRLENRQFRNTDAGASELVFSQIEEPELAEPFADENKKRDPQRAVVLIDEIDKADPDVPNDLLEAFGLNSFVVEEIGRRVVRQPATQSDNAPSYNRFGDLLIILTTNQERDLPQAFLRRCVVFTIEEPRDKELQIKRLLDIAKLHLKPLPEIAKTLAAKTVDLRADAKKRFVRAPSTAEFLDAVLTCSELGINPESDEWQRVLRSLLIKDVESDRVTL